MPITNRDFKLGDKLVAMRAGTKYAITAIESGNESKPLAWRMTEPKGFKSPAAEGSRAGGKDGRTFASIGLAMKAIYFPKDGPNRYTFWTEEDLWVSPEKRAARAARERLDPSKRPTAKEQAAEILATRTPRRVQTRSRARPNGQSHSLVEFEFDKTRGQYYCPACLAYFDGEAIIHPAMCDKGHTEEQLRGFAAADAEAAASETDEDAALAEEEAETDDDEEELEEEELEDETDDGVDEVDEVVVEDQELTDDGDDNQGNQLQEAKA